jgi:hypothetical protein
MDANTKEALTVLSLRVERLEARVTNLAELVEDLAGSSQPGPRVEYDGGDGLFTFAFPEDW